MAAIDHTIIAFKNSKLMENTCFYYIGKEVEKTFEDTGEKYTAYEGEVFKNLLPFETNRDGLITFRNESDYLEDIMEVFPNMPFNHYNYLLHKDIDFNKLAEDENLDTKRIKWCKRYRKKLLKGRERYLKYLKSKDYRVNCPEEYKDRFYYLNNENAEILAMYSDTQSFCVTFYYSKNTKDTYITFGGYGHNSNPYLHFYARGYGKEFERKMCNECYKWLMEDILPECLSGVGLDPNCWHDSGNYQVWLERFNHIHWLDDRWKARKRKALIALDPDSTDEKEKEWQKQFEN